MSSFAITVVCYTTFGHRDTDDVCASQCPMPGAADFTGPSTEMGEEAMQCARQLGSQGRDESRPICPMPVASVMPRPHSPIGGS